MNRTIDVVADISSGCCLTTCLHRALALIAGG